MVSVELKLKQTVGAPMRRTTDTMITKQWTMVYLREELLQHLEQPVAYLRELRRKRQGT